MEQKHCSELDTERCETTAAYEKCLLAVKELQSARLLAKYMEEAKTNLKAELSAKDQLLRLAEDKQAGLRHTLSSQVSLLSRLSFGVASLSHSSTPVCFAYLLTFLPCCSPVCCLVCCVMYMWYFQAILTAVCMHVQARLAHFAACG